MMKISEKRTKPFVSVVLSFYNEENVLRELIKRLRTMFCQELEKGVIDNYELIFVNDASTDTSLTILKKEFEQKNDIVVVDMSRNFGVSECVIAGMTYAKGDAVIYMDADLQDPPEVIPELINKWQQDDEVEVVYTTRLSRRGEHSWKLFITKLGYRFINKISDIDLPIDSGDFKLLSRKVVDELINMKEKKPYLRGLVSWVGFKQVQVFYHRDERYDGRENTKFPVISQRVIYGYLDKALISFSDAPLKAALLIGFIISTISILYIAVVIIQKIFGFHEPGWPALMAAILLLGGMQLSIMGMIGLYINTIYLEVKKRPNYIIKDLISNGKNGFNKERY